MLALFHLPVAFETPAWSYVPQNQHEMCLSVGSDERWGFIALPEGTPPARGWPLYIQFVIDLFAPSHSSSKCGAKPRRVKKYGAFDTPNATLATCFNSAASPWPKSNCDYDQESGGMWDQRLKQYLVANGIAVLQLNPRYTDTWDNSPLWWEGKDPSASGGMDKLFLPGPPNTASH